MNIVRCQSTQRPNILRKENTMNMKFMVKERTEMIAEQESSDGMIDVMKLCVAVAEKMDMDVKIVHSVIAAILEAFESEAFWWEIQNAKQGDVTTANEYEGETMEEVHEDGFQIGYRAGWNDAMAKLGNDDLSSIDYDDRCYDDRQDEEDYEE